MFSIRRKTWEARNLKSSIYANIIYYCMEILNVFVSFHMFDQPWSPLCISHGLLSGPSASQYLRYSVVCQMPIVTAINSICMWKERHWRPFYSSLKEGAGGVFPFLGLMMVKLGQDSKTPSPPLNVCQNYFELQKMNKTLLQIIIIELLVL